MNHQKLISKLDGYRTRNSLNHCYINEGLYRILYDRDIYYIAYNNIKSNDGSETVGSDGTSLHGFKEAWIDDIISSLRDESYHPLPNRITFIPKKNGKMRKLSFPNGKDKLIQEAVRIILECIYEPTFSNLSHGFRPKRSIHSALGQVETWTNTAWFIEGDISACFDEIDHRVLESILRERIHDERFIRLINKLLKAGYFDMQHQFHNSKQGAAQGSTCSPILCNIYLDKLDRFMESIIERDTKGVCRKRNPKYNRLRYQLNKAIKENNTKLIKQLRKELKTVHTYDEMDSSYRRIKYVRYADDFLVGTISNKEYAKALKQEIKEFLNDVLHLRLNDEKTKITNAKHDKVHFLGYIVTKNKYLHLEILMDMDKIIHRLHDNGMCDIKGYPTSIKHLFCSSVEDIITYGNQVLRGLVNNNQGCANFYKCHRIQYIVQFSIAKTIARKFDMSIKSVFKERGKSLLHKYRNEKGLSKSIYLAMFHSFQRDSNFFKVILYRLKQPIDYKYNDTNPLGRKCYICGNPHQLNMFHRPKKSRIKSPCTPIVQEMIRIHRRQICLCDNCFEKANSNQNLIRKR